MRKTNQAELKRYKLVQYLDQMDEHPNGEWVRYEDIDTRPETDQAERAEPVAGWKLVPIKPTIEMLMAGFAENTDAEREDYIYAAMLAAAPVPAQALEATPEVTDERWRNHLLIAANHYQDEAEEYKRKYEIADLKLQEANATIAHWKGVAKAAKLKPFVSQSKVRAEFTDGFGRMVGCSKCGKPFATGEPRYHSIEDGEYHVTCGSPALAPNGASS